jgi:23S rRNA (guanosine2251-2'-O)-methyltransferase
MLTDAGYRLYGLGASGGEPLFAAKLPERAAFVLGGETAGISAEVTQLLTGTLSIPMPGDVESLNVSAAAAVLCFDLVRRETAR